MAASEQPQETSLVQPLPRRNNATIGKPSPASGMLEFAPNHLRRALEFQPYHSEATNGRRKIEENKALAPDQ